MKFGVNLPQYEAFGDVRVLAQLARDAEAAGWDAFFIWDHILFDDLWHPMVDPWVAVTGRGGRPFAGRPVGMASVRVGQTGH